MFKTFNLIYLEILAVNDANWQVEVYTSKIGGASTSARVYMTLYGDQGKTGEVWLNEAYSTDENAFFEQGSSKIFKFNLPHIGTPYKLRIRHDGTANSPNWHLDKVTSTHLHYSRMFIMANLVYLFQVIVKHLPTKRSYFFTCDRWLTLEGKPATNVCEMPAFGSDIGQPLPGKYSALNKFKACNI